MKFINRQFAEFKSIFISEDILKENEEHANIVTASTMLNLFWISLITWFLTFFDIFKIGLPTMNKVIITAFVLLVLPSIICFQIKGKGKWIKHLLMSSFIIAITIADTWLKYNTTILMVIPVILAARYYNKKFTLATAIASTITIIISTLIGVSFGEIDLNIYNRLIEKGTNLTIDTTIKAEVLKLDIDRIALLKNTLIQFLLPKIFVYNIVAFACVQVSQSGKNMIVKQKETAEKDARIATELGLANNIQKSMLPSIFPPFPKHKEIDIYATMIPAKEIGGDFYDMFLIDDNHLAICVADVSGKGVPASLVMMISKILIKNVTKIDYDVDKAFTRVNNMLCDGNTTGIFITSWFGIIDLRSGKVEFVNAGHNPPLIYSKKKNEFSYLRTKPNLVLAGLENVKYSKNEITIEPGDKIFLYTDGVTEATNANNELYGEERLLNFLNNHLELNTEETIKSVKEDIDEFVDVAPQFDDITMLELTYKGKTNNSYTKEKEFNALKSELPKVEEFVEKELLKQNCNSKTINNINLAIEEIFVNIASYSYQDKTGKCLLRISYDGNNIFTITFEDTGIKFNPLTKTNPDISLSSKDRDIGGLGIFLTKKIMDDISYKYENNKNILTITKKI